MSSRVYPSHGVRLNHVRIDYGLTLIDIDQVVSLTSRSRALMPLRHLVGRHCAQSAMEPALI